MKRAESLLHFPLFQGMSSYDIEMIADEVHLISKTMKKNKCIIREGQKCEYIYLLVKGCVLMKSYSDSHSFHITEKIYAPATFQIEHLYGIDCRHSKEFHALESSELIAISKSDVQIMSDRCMVFRINLLNALSTHIQKLSRTVWHHVPDRPEKRFLLFLHQHTLYPAGEKTIHITMSQLAQEIHESRLITSRMLKHLHERGIIECRRNQIIIHQMEQLSMFL